MSPPLLLPLKITLLLTFLLTLSFSLSSAHECIHDRMEQIKKSHQIEDHFMTLEEAPLKNLYTQKRNDNRPEHENIRIHLATDLLLNDQYTCYRVGDVITASDSSKGTTTSFTCGLDDVLTASKLAYLKDTLLADAKTFLEDTLKVIRQSGDLRISVSNCGGYPLTVTVPSSYQNPGVEADFVIFVTARPILGSSALAFASSCSANALGRPVAGHANFNVSNLVDYEGDYTRQLGIAIHEITHALGFSSGRFSTFIKWLDGGNYQRMSASEVFQTVSTKGYTQSRIVTPTVQEVVRDHYDCLTLEGAELEDGGSSGTAGSHWEKRIMMSEYMTGTANQYPVYSKITLALLYDSGWYDINWDNAETLLWGKNAGCDFVEGSCGSETDWDGYYCDVSSSLVNLEQECTVDLRGYGTCNVRTWESPLPEYWQYFDDPKKGGHSLYSNYCPYIPPIVSCVMGAENLNSALNGDIKGLTSTGQSFHATSLCFQSTLLKLETGFKLEDFGITDVAQSIQAPRCYNATCVAPLDLRIQVDEIWYECPSGGGEIDNVIKYGGKIICPSNIADICSKVKRRDNSWPRITSIDPVSGGASTFVTISGENFDVTDTMKVIIDGECTNITIVDSKTITAVLPDSSYFVSISDLGIFETKKTIILIDARGYSDFLEDRFTIDIAFDEIYITALLNWMSENPLWAVIAVAIFLLPVAILMYCCCKACNQPKKPSKAEDKLIHKEDFYDDDFGVDDYYDYDYE